MQKQLLIFIIITVTYIYYNKYKTVTYEKLSYTLNEMYRRICEYMYIHVIEKIPIVRLY